MDSKADASRTRELIWQGNAVPVLAAELAMPAVSALPPLQPLSVLYAERSFRATSVRLATVAARYSWNRILALPK